MFDMCSVMERKNPLALIRAFRLAFETTGGVSLAIKVLRGHAFMDDFLQLQEAAAAAGVHLIDGSYTHQETLGLLNSCDAYVSLHRSEGFGLTMAEAMLMGKPVVATGYSGNLDFMNPSNSLLVGYDLVPITRDTQFYAKGNRWAEPSIEDAAQKMRWLFDHQTEARALGEKARQDATALLSLEAAARRMTTRIDQIRLLTENSTSSRS
jgi:glycosyltransferase involved in cell wall biosynthesis